MSHDAWAAIALETHPFTVRRLHELYIEAGVDVITTNTYASARHNLAAARPRRQGARAEPSRGDAGRGRPRPPGEGTSGMDRRLGLELRAHGRVGARLEGLSGTSATGRRRATKQARTNLHEQAEILAESGVDFLIAEPTGSTVQRRWVIEACVATGLPVWSGFKCHHDDSADGSLKVGYQVGRSLRCRVRLSRRPRRRGRHRVPLPGGCHRRRARGGQGALERPDRHLSRGRAGGLCRRAPRRIRSRRS